VGYREALNRLRANHDYVNVARYDLELVRHLGQGSPLAVEAEAEARAIFTRVGARRYLEVLDAAVAEGAIVPRQVDARRQVSVANAP
jgi:hypothetical protein